MPTAKQIMSRDFLAVTPATAVGEFAAALEKSSRSGAVVLDDEGGGVVGVVTEGDLIDRHKNIHLPTVITIFDWVLPLSGRGETEKELRKMSATTVGDIMSMDPVTVDVDATLEDIATIMSERRKHFLPVMDGERLAGVIDRSDVLRAIIKEES
ncbi:MAG: CBS domain-containing protein [Candidatus Nitrospinota bacterium M3_3B_026]